jgi:polyhydroxybutyrate depolymerase
MSWSRFSGLVALVALSCTPQESAPPTANPYPYSYAPPGAYPSNPPMQGGPQGPAPAPGSGSPGCGKAPAKIGASAHRVTVLGRERAYTVVVPEGYAPQTPYPLVFVLHGGGSSAAGARTQTDLEKASAGRAVFVYPDGIGGNWNLDAPAGTSGDVALFDAILLTTHNTLCLDARRVFLTGFSNGAYMANQLACKRGERIRGIVTHAGGGPYEASGGSYDATGHLTCPGKAVASLVVHGNVDGTVPPAEGQKTIDHWSYANRCNGGTTSAWTPPCVALQGCFQPVGVCRIPGLGHGLWSQAGKVTWAFFDALK